VPNPSRFGGLFQSAAAQDGCRLAERPCAPGQHEDAGRPVYYSWVESELGAGSTFFLEVPLDVEQQVGNA
jgi:hypothetical protein